MLHKTIFYLSVEHDLLFTKIVILTEIPIEFELPSSVATTVVLSHVQLLIPTCNPWGADKVFFCQETHSSPAFVVMPVPCQRLPRSPVIVLIELRGSCGSGDEQSKTHTTSANLNVS